MTNTYNISGMTGNGGVAKVKSELLKFRDVKKLMCSGPQPTGYYYYAKAYIGTNVQSALQKEGNYTITEADAGMNHVAIEEETKSWFNDDLLNICKTRIAGEASLLCTVQTTN